VSQASYKENQMNFQDVPYVNFKGVKVNNICYRTVLDTVGETLQHKGRGYICLTDVSNLIVASKNPQMRTAINDSLLSLADGTPLVWFAWMAGCKEIERISGASLLQRLLGDLADRRHYLLGDTERVIERVIVQAKQINANIEITGHSPPFKEFDAEDNRVMLEKIRQARPDIVWVCFGGGKQESWMREHFSDLDQGIMIGVGAAFKFFIGDIVTPPQIFQKMGLQWLFRLTHEFIKNPTSSFFKTVSKRQIMSSKVEYLLSFPGELSAARRELKTAHTVKKPR
jgi:N-acetylglucosaminyldiphosphoundecaprenol N-acetyl-beta-D-mannosaminyltransferase